MSQSGPSVGVSMDTTQVEAALAYFDAHQNVVDAVPSARHGGTLAAAVRELTRDNDRKFNIILDRNGRVDDLTAQAQRAEAALAELRGRTCATCRHRRENSVDHYDYCGHVPVSCATVGNTCGAWAAKEQA